MTMSEESTVEVTSSAEDTGSKTPRASPPAKLIPPGAPRAHRTPVVSQYASKASSGMSTRSSSSKSRSSPRSIFQSPSPKTTPEMKRKAADSAYSGKVDVRDVDRGVLLYELWAAALITDGGTRQEFSSHSGSDTYVDSHCGKKIQVDVFDAFTDELDGTLYDSVNGIGKFRYVVELCRNKITRV